IWIKIMAYTSDLCSVINCQHLNYTYKPYDIYVCFHYFVHSQCEQNQLPRRGWCRNWNMVVGYTGQWIPTMSDGNVYRDKDIWDQVKIQRDYSTTQNPITISLNWTKLPTGIVIRNETTKHDVIAVDYTRLTPKDIMSMATGYTTENLWLKWLMNTAKENGADDCVACASARPQLFTEPAPLFPNDTWGYNCMFKLTHEGHLLLTKAKGTMCALLIPIQIPSKAVGICAIVRLGAPLVIIGQNKLVPVGITPHLGATLTRKRKRHTLEKRDANSFDLTLNSPTYIDAIGVPRGIPNEYKLQDQVAAGFASLPIISAIFPVQPNKNVDFINYVHFNVLRLTNLMRDAIEVLSEQLAPTSQPLCQYKLETALDKRTADAYFQQQAEEYVASLTKSSVSVKMFRDKENLSPLREELETNN
uniref:Uncharacterized protein n=1 Tax=Cynoglossus semilaevis TaxID=244447 RepID=A0A3P8VGV8_CYNSE